MIFQTKKRACDEANPYAGWLRSQDFFFGKRCAFSPKGLFQGRLEELQEDVEKWMKEYNEERPHSGKYCYGKTPWETFKESKHLAQSKMLDQINLTTGVVG